MRTDSTAIAGIAMGEAREVIGQRYGATYTMPKGRVYKTKSKGAQEAHESIRPTSFRRDPDSLQHSLKPEELRLYRLIWQRALASQMAAKELETTTIDLADGAYELRASATRVLFDGFARVYTEGRDDDGADDEETGQLPGLDRRRPDDRRGGQPNPAFHRAAAALHGGDPDQGARGARDRAPVHLRRHHLDDHGSRLRPGRGAPAPPRTGGRDRHGPPGRAFRRLRRRRVHGAHGGGARRGLAWRAGVGAAAARVLRPVARPGRREATRAAAAGLHHGGHRRGLLRGPPDGHPAGPQRAVPGLLALSRAQGEPAAARRRAAAPGRDRRGLPQVRRGDAGRQARPVRPVRGLLALSRLRLHQEGRPTAARPAAVRGDLSEEPRRSSGPASRPTDRQRLLGLLQLSALRLHHERRAARRAPRRSTTARSPARTPRRSA